MLVTVSGSAQSVEGRSCTRRPLSRVRSCGFDTRWGSGTAGRESGARSAPDGNTDCAEQSAVPGAPSDPPRPQAVGAGQREGGEEDFSSRLNLLENLACSPSS